MQKAFWSSEPDGIPASAERIGQADEIRDAERFPAGARVDAGGGDRLDIADRGHGVAQRLSTLRERGGDEA